MDEHRIKVLLVDDSAAVRSALRILIRRQPDMQVIGAAANGAEGVRLAQVYDPDIVIMDIEMPVMSGIEAVKSIMAQSPRPILMFSSLTTESAPATLDALDAGALDYVTKDAIANALNVGESGGELIESIRALARRRTPSPVPLPSRPLKTLTTRIQSAYGLQPRSPIRLIAIAASTGGPQALRELFGALSPRLSVPVVVVQHMPASFSASFAQRLKESCALEVRLAADADALIGGSVVIAPGDMHIRVVSREQRLWVALSGEKVPDMLHMPSASVLFESLRTSVGGGVLVVVLTGMGADGADGAQSLHQAGATVIAQDEASCVVYGMPRAVVERGVADAIMPLSRIGPLINRLSGPTT